MKHMYLNNDLFLPKELRKKLAKPQGKLFTGVNPEKNAIRYIKKCNPTLTITVGDICTASLLKEGYRPNLILIDYKTKRMKIEKYFSDVKEFELQINKSYTHKMLLKNPQGQISKEAWSTIESAIQKIALENEYIRIVIQGEEDLLALPCILLAPLKSIIVYGQPNQGIVSIYTTQQKRKKVQSLLNSFEIKEKSC